MGEFSRERGEIRHRVNRLKVEKENSGRKARESERERDAIEVMK